MERIIVVSIVILLASTVITAFLTAFAGFSVSDRDKRILSILSIGLLGLSGDAVLAVLINHFLDHRWNILYTFRQWLAFNFTYQDIDKYATFLILLNIAAFFGSITFSVCLMVTGYVRHP